MYSLPSFSSDYQQFKFKEEPTDPSEHKRTTKIKTTTPTTTEDHQQPTETSPIPQVAARGHLRQQQDGSEERKRGTRARRRGRSVFQQLALLVALAAFQISHFHNHQVSALNAAQEVAVAAVASVASAAASAALESAQKKVLGGSAASSTATASTPSGSLSKDDARSILSPSLSSVSPLGHQHHHQRSPGLNLAIKIADAIPEVPYNILHNMKKLDHAAPFYNIENKASNHLGASKESTHSLFSSALSGSSGAGLNGAADQLISLFRSPIWKRLADGYGEFTSEFRSLFRAPPTTMKGPSSSTTKLLRDISVPALLMLLASSMPSEWRPSSVKTRRKSPTLPVGESIQAAIANSGATFDPLNAAPGVDQQVAATNSLLFRPQPQNGATNFNFGGLEGRNLNQVEQTFGGNNQIARASDINLEQTSSGANEVALGSNWIQQQQQNHLLAPTSSMLQQEQQQQQQQLIQPIKRIGDSTNGNIGTNFKQSPNTKPVEMSERHSSSNEADPAFGSLTSTGGRQTILMNRIMEPNGGGHQQQVEKRKLPLFNSYKLMSLSEDELNKKRFGQLPAARTTSDQLNDKPPFSTLNSFASNSDSADNALNELQGAHKTLSASSSSSSSPPSPQTSKPFPLSSMTHALTSIFSPSSNSDSTSAPSAQESGSKLVSQPASNFQQLARHISKSKRDRTMLRRNQQQQSLGGIGGEQRDLTQLLPQSWKEVMKRTVNNVQQQASTQWRTIEGQLSSWLQDKLKTIPSSPSAGSGPVQASASQPVASIIATVGSTAMNILGIGNKNSSVASAFTMSAPVNSPADKNKNEATFLTNNKSTSTSSSSSSSSQPQPLSAKGTLVGVANLIVNSLTSGRQAAPSSQNSPNSSSKSSQGSESAPVAIHQYPTLTGAQPSISSMASGTASTVAALSSMAN